MYTTLENVWWIFLAGLGTGLLGALLGTGGGVFLIPILVLGIGVPMHFAIATSILSVIATSSAAAVVNVERGTVNMRLGMSLEVMTALGAIAGGIVAGWLSASFLELLFGLVLLPTALLMWRGREGSGTDTSTFASTTVAISTSKSTLDGTYIDDNTQKQVTYHVVRLWAGMLVSFVAGSLSGVLGIGGGVFKVPALNLLCNVPIKAAAATSNFMIGVTAAASAFLYYGRGEVRPALTATVVLGVLAGSLIGTRLTRYFSGNHLRKLFAALLVLVAAQMLARSIVVHATPEAHTGNQT